LRIKEQETRLTLHEHDDDDDDDDDIVLMSDNVTANGELSIGRVQLKCDDTM
jgi:hypothetical protein